MSSDPQPDRQSIYSLDVLIEQARQLAADFRRATGQILPVSGEIARFDVAKHLGLQLLDKPQDGVDAVGDGLNYQIKGRLIIEDGKAGQRIGQVSPDGNWDVLAVALMDADFQPYEIYLGQRDEVLDALNDTSEKRRKRGALSIAKFKIIAELAWTKEDGLEPGLWANQP